MGERAGSRPRVAGLSALLADISTLRTTLQTDLSLAAAALDEGAEDVAGALIAGDAAVVQDFEARAFATLAAMDGRTPIRHRLGAMHVGAMHVGGGHAGGGRRRLVPTAPLLVAAAALVGFAVGVVPDPPDPAPVMSSAAGASYELNRLAVAGASSAQLRTAAEQLNEEVAAVVAASGGSPAATAEALLLLERGNEVLLEHRDPRQVQGVLTETRQLADQLLSTLPPYLQQSFPRLSQKPPFDVPGRLDLPLPIVPFPVPTISPPALPGPPVAPLRSPGPGGVAPSLSR